MAISLFAIGILLIIVEMLTGTFVLLWLGIATLAASAVIFTTESIWLALLVFAVTAIGLWLGTKKFGKNVHKGQDLQSGIYSYIGKEVLVHSVDKKDNTIGTIMIHGEEWIVKSSRSLIANQKVSIKDIEGATLMVEAI
ncbi:NfeD family protein [Priestia taiwanensis]|uniref:NfeD family protein n=1 Tax=Priestia taiwanensis TaxID=1347902 RepID=UPI0016648D38|nr:NfeD family protein [Priestia taiwanensis]MBM7361886.1 membrane protein implicated in regulation of membrane protease activity [Priestia taiwanensis]